MAEYAILLPGDETAWARSTPEQRAAVYARHTEFAQLLADRGHTVTGGAELAHSSEAKVVRGTLDDVTVTDGPYAETVEQLTGFYLAGAEGTLEVREMVGS